MQLLSHISVDRFLGGRHKKTSLCIIDNVTIFYYVVQMT